jgi:hypothetical protein
MFERRYTVPQTAKATGFSKSKVRNLIHSGRLFAINTSTGDVPRWEVPESSICSFLEPRSNKKEEST